MEEKRRGLAGARARAGGGPLRARALAAGCGGCPAAAGATNTAVAGGLAGAATWACAAAPRWQVLEAIGLVADKAQGPLVVQGQGNRVRSVQLPAFFRLDDLRHALNLLR